MAEIKNSFLASKMNKDLDDRLIPNNEYRDALNIEVGKSKQDSVGALQIALGNVQLLKPGSSGQVPFETNPDLICIGFFADNKNNRIFQFLTDYEDQNPSLIDLPDDSYEMKITVWDPSSSTPYRTLVSGTFLNFSKTNLIIGVNLIEDLLFFTDNRNQPRKINVTNAINDANYYYNEVQISVAKYAPLEPISLIKKATATVDAVTSTTEFDITPIKGSIVPGMTVLSLRNPQITGEEYISVKSVTTDSITGEVTGIELYQPPISPILVGTELIFLISTMTDKSDALNWPGDPSFLEDKFVRFSYRFKFDDNEYSLIAPFTQIAYIPKQKGFFINGDESSAYRSTVVKWMENNINNIELLIPLPDKGTKVRESYKITKVDILYKESDSNEIKVIDSIPFNSLTDSNVYTYAYQSQKPYKTLSPDQTTRVYDNIPVRALGQEVSGNRIIYGNFHTTYSAPSSINYNTTVNPKQSIFDNFIEYPNHTLKQNRNYQVGFVLADKFGRSSSVILSSFDSTIATPSSLALSLGGSTIYAPYQSENESNFPNVREWFGNALAVLVNTPIESTRSIPNGTPGLYATPTSTNGFSITSGATINTPAVLPNIGYKYRFTLNTAVGIVNTIPKIGDSLRGKYIDYVKVINVVPPSSPAPNPPAGIYDVYTDKEINDLYLFDVGLTPTPNTKYVYTINEIGWYSYKVVVKQQQQDYYNVYLPGMLQGYPTGQTFGSQVVYTSTGTSSTPLLENGINTTDFPVGEADRTSHIVLINDNINKVPRDLTEVGPDQKQYRSSVILFGKVENKAATTLVKVTPGSVLEDPFCTGISFSTVDYPDAYRLIKVGDGIQSASANIPVPNPLNPSAYPDVSLPNPDRWYANTVVTSITLSADGLTGLIKFTPPNWTRDSGAYETEDIIITRAENTQYFPTRKGDTVTSIATAVDFNFNENNVANIKGSAAINFYQLQTRPLIGRISTVNSIGVGAEQMIPFLSVYETSPEVSLLALFWETATNGYISDLNWDVLTGYDGPSRFSEFDFAFWEDQNHLGTDSTEGNPNSKYITSKWKILNSTGLPLFPDSVTLLQVSDNASPPNDNLAPGFGVELAPGTANEYRLYIKKGFLFDHQANTNSIFTFIVNITIGSNYYQLPITGRLGNREPYFLGDDLFYSRTINQVPGFVVTVTAKNGSALATSQLTGLCWDILSGNTNNYFSIDSQSGEINLINSSIPLGVYDLYVRVRDAMDFTNPSNPQPLINAANPEYGTLESVIIVRIFVGAKRVNDYLSYYDTGEGWVWAVQSDLNNPDGPLIMCGSVPGQGYGAVYIGAENITLDEDGFSPLLPPYSYQKFVNVQVANGATFGSGYPPTGLTQGELEFTINNYLNGEEGTIKSNLVDFTLYWRQSMFAPNNDWIEIADENGIYAAQGIDLEIFSPIGEAAYGTRGNKIVVGLLGEYCLVVKNYEYTDDYEVDDPVYLSCNIGDHSSVQVIVQDANYTYGGNEPNPGPPITNVYEYLVGGFTYEIFPNIPYPIGIPYDTQDATKTLTDVVLANPIGGPLADPNELILSTANARLVNGLSYTPSSWNQANTGSPYTASSSGQIITLSGSDFYTGTYRLVLGMKMTHVAGAGSFAANTVVTEIISGTQFKVSITPPTALSGSKITADNNWLGIDINLNHKITDITPDGLKLILSWNPGTTVPAGVGALIPFGTKQSVPDPYQSPVPTGFQGSVYASTDNPLHVRQFYIDSTLITPWQPPIPNKFYVFQNKNTNFNIVNRSSPFGRSNGLKDITGHPFFCAKFDSAGKIIGLPSPQHTVQTAWGEWTGGLPPSGGIRLSNTDINVYQSVAIPPAT